MRYLINRHKANIVKPHHSFESICSSSKQLWRISIYFGGLYTWHPLLPQLFFTFNKFDSHPCNWTWLWYNQNRLQRRDTHQL